MPLRSCWQAPARSSQRLGQVAGAQLWPASQTSIHRPSTHGSSQWNFCDGRALIARRANHPLVCPAPVAKIFLFSATPNHLYNSRYPVPTRGALRGRHGRRERDAVDAVASGARSACGRMMLQRTAKSCGPDAPTLVSSWRSNPSMTVANKPGHRGEHEGSR
jgi:hypothetical protein